MQLFISDLHLHESRPETARLFFSFIDGPARRARQLVILGDLFEYWAGDDDIDAPLHAAVCGALKALHTGGVDIRFLAGNRDFLIGAGFSAATGATLLPDLLTHAVAGTPTLLLHGDTLCADDADYQDYRRRMRDPAFIDDFLHLPLAERKATIENLRKRSETEKRRKNTEIMDVNDNAVREAFRHAGVTRMIHGHIHRLAMHPYEIKGKSCERWVLGDWNTTGNFLECDEAGWRFRAWDGIRASAL